MKSVISKGRLSSLYFECYADASGEHMTAALTLEVWTNQEICVLTLLVREYNNEKDMLISLLIAA